MTDSIIDISNNMSFQSSEVEKASIDSDGNFTAPNVPSFSSGAGVPSSTPAKAGNVYFDTTNEKFYDAKGTSSSADWVKRGGSYTIQTRTTGAGTLTASSTLYFGDYGQVWIGRTATYGYFPKSGTVSAIGIIFFEGAGSSEASSLYLRINDTTDYLISSSIVNDSIRPRYYIPDLDIPVSAGDLFTYKIVTPAYSTEPTGVQVRSYIAVDL